MSDVIQQILEPPYKILEALQKNMEAPQQNMEHPQKKKRPLQKTSHDGQGGAEGLLEILTSVPNLPCGRKIT